MDDYDIPFDGMSEDEFLYRAMNEDNPMYMGRPTTTCSTMMMKSTSTNSTIGIRSL